MAPLAQGPAVLPAWKANAALTKQLGPAFDLGSYTVRPPRGYELAEQKHSPLHAYMWRGEVRQDGTAPGFVALIMTPPTRDAKVPPLEQMLEAYLRGERRNRADAKSSKPERGRVGELTLLRAYVSGIDTVHGYTVHGFAYVFSDGKAGYTLAGQDIEPYSAKTLPLLEAAALSLRNQSPRR